MAARTKRQNDRNLAYIDFLGCVAAFRLLTRLGRSRRAAA